MDHKQNIITLLEVLAKKEVANKEPFKAKAYFTVIKNIKALDKPIKDFDDLKGVKGIGEKISTKLKEYFETGKIQEVENVGINNKVYEIQELMKIHGIGPSKAKTLVDEHNILSISQLSENTHLLNDKQKMGLKYYADFQERIPRKEMDAHNQYLTKVIASIDSKFTFDITGSYRRGLPSSGDIDILITHQDDPENVEELFKAVLSKLKDAKYITDVFAEGGKKCLAVCRLPRRKKFRRIDLLYTNKTEYPFALLYFTGDASFNVSMRNHCLSIGYSLSEHGLKNESNGQYIDTGAKTEEDVFTFIGFPYIEPSKRSTT
jgi:DNA polymerase beta